MTPEFDRLQLGCGTVTPAGWLNVDGSFAARLARHPRLYRAVCRLTGRKPAYEGTGAILWLDVRRPLPWPDACFSAVYASHLLEHLHVDEADRLLAECFRVMKPGGVIRLIVPDLAAQVHGYLTGEFPAWMAADAKSERGEVFVRGLLMREPATPRGNFFSRVRQALYDFHSHKWMYDGPSLRSRMARHGFVDLREMGVWESRIPGIEKFERRDRVEQGAGVVVEGIKPAH